MKAYMKHHFDFYGIKSPVRKELQKKCYHSLPEHALDDVAILWQSDQREAQYAAQELLFKAKRQWDKNTIHFIEELIVTKSWWDTVDYLASTCVGHYFKMFPDQMDEITSRWNNSENIWLVRSSIIFQLKYKGETDKNKLKLYCIRHQDKTEFFIKKAIGWALRQYSKFEPNWVITTVEEASFQPLSQREALRLIKN